MVEEDWEGGLSDDVPANALRPNIARLEVMQ